MALVWGTGFDYAESSGGLALEYGHIEQDSGAGYIERGPGRYGSGYSCQFPTLGSIARVARGSLAAEASTVTVGFAFYLDATAPFANTNIFHFYAADTTIQFTVRIDADRSLKICNGSGTTALIQTAADACPASSWTYVEFTVVISDTVGTAQIWINGTSAASGTSLDTRGSTGGSNVHLFEFGSNIAGSSRPLFRFDDMYIRDDSTRYGPCRWDYFPPTADTADADGTPSTGSTDFGVLDDTPWASSDYLSLSTVGDLVILDHGIFTENPTTVHAVQLVAGVAKMEAGDRTFRGVLKQSGTVYNGSTTGFGSGSSRTVWWTWETNPATSTAWTMATVNSVDFGMEIVT